MSESSGASFPIFGSEELCNLLATENVTSSGETPQSTLTLARTDLDEVSVRQTSLARTAKGRLAA